MNNKNTFSVESFHIPRWNELPTIDLYLDQVVNLINSFLSPYIFFKNDIKKEDSDELLTKTMINNYVKNNLIEAPIKKQYSRNQIAKLFVICVLKQVYSMQDIKKLIDIALMDSTIQIAYDKFCKLFEQALLCTFTRKDFIDKNSSSDNLYLLKSVLLSCSYKIYVEYISFIKSEKS
ncbi:MAG: DUF1836 domain-containing protein [Clostridia bacterium]|jgi:hypothetical protein|nr:DUF1836 domain-containing protein [Clostridia bacterium]